MKGRRERGRGGRLGGKRERRAGGKELWIGRKEGMQRGRERGKKGPSASNGPPDWLCLWGVGGFLGPSSGSGGFWAALGPF